VTNYDHHPLLPASSARTQAERLAIRTTGQRRHSAEPAEPPKLPPPPRASGDGPHIVIVDTGLVNPLPVALHNVESRRLTANVRRQQPDDVSGIEDGRLDPAAGHGTFIAGIIEMIAPACTLSVRGPVTSYGDIDEADLAKVLTEVAALDPKPDLVNLSLGGYSVADMPLLARAVRQLQGLPKNDKKKGKPTIVVASAGNDATCRPTYPAALPGVVSVGALGPFGAAPFTNYGPWVRACAPGVDVVSTFYDGLSKADGDDFTGWACWSGTSFATPAVVGALAMAMQHGLTKKQAVDRLIDDLGLFRIPGLGAVVNQTPWWLQSN
jgi:hypothetical protein